jgi:hypothetical protein
MLLIFGRRVEFDPTKKSFVFSRGGRNGFAFSECATLDAGIFSGKNEKIFRNIPLFG